MKFTIRAEAADNGPVRDDAALYPTALKISGNTVPPEDPSYAPPPKTHYPDAHPVRDAGQSHQEALNSASPGLRRDDVFQVLSPSSAGSSLHPASALPSIGIFVLIIDLVMEATAQFGACIMNGRVFYTNSRWQADETLIVETEFMFRFVVLMVTKQIPVREPSSGIVVGTVEVV
jgi:hypothetical protein